MGKKILVVYYSQSGQLKQIAENFASPFSTDGNTVEYVQIKMKNEFPFPWRSKSFFDAMPESVLGIPAEVIAPQFKEEKYDLVVFAYQPWYLSPSIPATSFLLNPEFGKRLKDTPVVTVIGSRNMWINAQERVKKMIKQNGGRLVGNIVYADRHNNFVSAVTIQYWMFTGKKDRWLGIFPTPGVADKEIADAGIFGSKVLEALKINDLGGLQSQLAEMKAVDPQTVLMFIEGRAPKIFSLWANLIIRKKNRSLWLQIFKYYLLFALFIIAPVIVVIYLVAIVPLTGRQIRVHKKYFSGVN
jgi:menaquinone-dependent protoporphyrinogen IX oxidase